MDYKELTHAGFSRTWLFSYPSKDNLSVSLRNIKMANDVSTVLRYLADQELLIATHAEFNKNKIAAFISSDTLGDLQTLLNTSMLFISEVKTLLESSEAADCYINIGGYGVVYEGSDKLLTSNLISIRFYNHGECWISTTTSIWIPFEIINKCPEKWQIDVAKINRQRLSKGLEEIKICLNAQVSPAENEIDKEEVIWIKGFQLYPEPDMARKFAKETPPESDFDLQEFLKPLFEPRLKII